LQTAPCLHPPHLQVGRKLPQRLHLLFEANTFVETGCFEAATMADMRSTPIESASPVSGTRNVVILLDGTGNRFSDCNSNVIKLMSVLKADETQLLYYSSGIGESWYYKTVISLKMARHTTTTQCSDVESTQTECHVMGR
jgi:hypothetical protein